MCLELLTIIQFILNGECHWITLHLQLIFQFLRSIFKPENEQLSKIAKKKGALLLKVLSSSKDLIWITSETRRTLNDLYKNSYKIWMKFSSNTQKLLLLQNIQNCGKAKNFREGQRSTDL